MCSGGSGGERVAQFVNEGENSKCSCNPQPKRTTINKDNETEKDNESGANFHAETEKRETSEVGAAFFQHSLEA